MIGFFDSGLGGLTILQEVIERCPQGTYVYLGDNARAPYGLRSAEEVRRFTTEGVAWLIEQGCELVILACNTASAHALRFLQQTWLPIHAPTVRVLGILVPTVEVITGVQWDEKHTTNGAPSVLVFATPSTVASGAYEREILKRSPRATVILQSCPDLVSLMEAAVPRAILQRAVHDYVQTALLRVTTPLDGVLLGCTHYALIEELFRACLPEPVFVLSQPKIVASALQGYLKRHPTCVMTQEGLPAYRFATTGDPDAVSYASHRLFPTRIVYEQVVLSV